MGPANCMTNTREKSMQKKVAKLEKKKFEKNQKYDVIPFLPIKRQNTIVVCQ